MPDQQRGRGQYSAADIDPQRTTGTYSAADVDPAWQPVNEPTTGAYSAADVDPAWQPVNEPEPTGFGQNMLEGIKGFGKGILATAQGMSPVHNISEMLGHPQGFDTSASNTPQMIGKGLETAAELAVPGAEGVKALPSAARAGAVLGRVGEAAEKAGVRVPLFNTGAPLGRVTQLGERGGVLPNAANSLLKRSQMMGDMSFPEARDYYSNISDLSADEAGKLNRKMKSAIGSLRAGFNQDLTKAADAVGMGHDYAQAMREYGQAMKLQNLGQSIKEGAARFLPKAIGLGGAGVVGYGLKKLIEK